MSRSARTVGLLVLVAAVLTAGAPSVIRVKPGDTLSAIAHAHHTTVQKLQASNHLKGTTIYAGELLALPGNAAATVRPKARKLALRAYTVTSGDSLTRIARHLHTTKRYLTELNHLRTTRVLIGQRILYTVTAGASAPAATSAVARSAAAHRAYLRSHPLPSKASVRALIIASARRNKVSVPFVLALAYQESGFQQRVVSPVDAIGAMQVLPSTGRTLERIHGRRFNLLVAKDNVEAGVLLIKDLLRATGSAPKALAGYYQGLGSVSRVGLLPQTRAYIRSISLLQRRFT